MKERAQLRRTLLMRGLRIRAAEGHPVNLEKALIVEMPQIKGKDGQ
jgi:hypothetical protein